MPVVRFKVEDAPNGENTSLAGTEKFPVDGSQYVLPTTIQTYTRALDNSYVMRAGFASSSPADATTYYFGAFGHVALGTAAAINRLYILRAGIVCAADVLIFATTGTSEVSTISFRLNNTTDSTLSNAVALNASPYHVQSTALNIAVAVGDYFEIKWLTPTWATNPTNVVGCVHVFIK